MVSETRMEKDLWYLIPKLTCHHTDARFLMRNYESHSVESSTHIRLMKKRPELLLTRLSTTKIGQIALSALSTGGFIATLFGTGWWGSLVGAVCSAMLLAVNLYSRSHDLGKLAQQHRDAAIEIWYIREQYSSLITDLAIGSASLTAIQDKRDILVDELKIVYAKCPNTSNKSYRIAHKALNFPRRDDILG